MEQYVTWANATGVVQQFYTDNNIQVSILHFLFVVTPSAFACGAQESMLSSAQLSYMASNCTLYCCCCLQFDKHFALLH